MNFRDIEDLRIDGGFFSLDSYSLFSVTGQDGERFLQGQLTSDVTSLKDQESQFTVRLNRVGQVVAWAYLAKIQNQFFLLVPNQVKEDLISDLEKYMIMDDVQIDFVSDAPQGVLGLNSELYFDKSTSFFHFDFNGESCLCFWGKGLESKSLELEKNYWKALEILSGQPILGVNVFKGQLVNETRLNSLGVNYSKGCFLGQETVAKIETRRGAAKFPILLTTNEIGSVENSEIYWESKKVGRIYSSVFIDEYLYIQASLGREQRVEGREFKFCVGDKEFIATVKHFPFFPYRDLKERAQQLYELGAKAFREGREERALQVLKKSIEFDPNLADAYESIGVILGRLEKYEQAMSYMDKLLGVDPDSVMAHTNKSLYLMKLGKIEEAEEEKAKATVAGFAQLGRDADQKKAFELARQKREEEIQRREKMFEQVLEIDPDDVLANYGMGDICFHRQNYHQALPFIEKVLEQNSKHSVAYLLMGKTLIALGEGKKAKAILEKGVVIAAQNGDLMPANEMQAQLSQIS